MPVSHTKNHIVIVDVYRHLEFYFEEYFFGEEAIGNTSDQKRDD